MVMSLKIHRIIRIRLIYFVSDKNEIIKYELNGKMTKLLDLNDVENKDYRGFTGKLYKCSNNRYCFVGDDGLKFIKKVN